MYEILAVLFDDHLQCRHVIFEIEPWYAVRASVVVCKSNRERERKHIIICDIEEHGVDNSLIGRVFSLTEYWYVWMCDINEKMSVGTTSIKY